MFKVKVTEIEKYNDSLFRFKTEKPDTFKFIPGEFTMIGLPDTKLFRAYSMVNGPADDYLEFLSVIVQDGPLTSKLQHIKIGDEIVVAPKTTGTLLVDSLHQDRNLWMLATGTGIAPFVSLCRDASTYVKFNRIFLCHTVRTKSDLAYYQYFLTLTTTLPMLQYYPTVTREDFANKGRITDLIKSGAVYKTLETEELDPGKDSVMLCGGPEFNKEMIAYLTDKNWTVGSKNEPGNFVYEKAFAA